MRILAIVKSVDMKKFSAYDSKTGAPDPGYILQMTVEDTDTEEKLQCSINEGFGMENLREARRAKASEQERDDIASQVLANAKQLEGRQLELIVGKPRAKGFVTFPVISLPIAQPAA